MNKCPKCGSKVTTPDDAGWGCENLECDWRITIGDLRNENEDLKKKVEKLEEELKKWPRVYFYSANPKSSTEGCRVLSVAGKNEKEWFDVTIDTDGEEIFAPTDFGIYSTIEQMETAREKEKAEKPSTKIKSPYCCPECGKVGTWRSGVHFDHEMICPNYHTWELGKLLGQ